MKIAIIPARGGSKRIPRKNIKEFSGKPMIAYSIACAMSSGLFDRVVVSTDDEEIAEVAKRYGAEVPFMRPAELSDDHTANAEVMAHAIDWLIEHGDDIEAVCCIFATAPFVRGEDLKRGYEALRSGPWQRVFSATTFAYPIFRSFQMTDSGGLEMFYPEHFRTRSQDLPEALHDAGQFVWGRPRSWHERTGGFDKESSAVLIPRWRVQDIDTMEDWNHAEKLFQTMNGED